MIKDFKPVHPCERDSIPHGSCKLLSPSNQLHSGWKQGLPSIHTTGVNGRLMKSDSPNGSFGSPYPKSSSIDEKLDQSTHVKGIQSPMVHESHQLLPKGSKTGLRRKFEARVEEFHLLYCLGGSSRGSKPTDSSAQIRLVDFEQGLEPVST